MRRGFGQCVKMKSRIRGEKEEVKGQIVGGKKKKKKGGGANVVCSFFVGHLKIGDNVQRKKRVGWL